MSSSPTQRQTDPSNQRRRRSKRRFSNYSWVPASSAPTTNQETGPSPGASGSRNCSSSNDGADHPTNAKRIRRSSDVGGGSSQDDVSSNPGNNYHNISRDGTTPDHVTAASVSPVISPASGIGRSSGLLVRPSENDAAVSADVQNASAFSTSATSNINKKTSSSNGAVCSSNKNSVVGAIGTASSSEGLLINSATTPVSVNGSSFSASNAAASDHRSCAPGTTSVIMHGKEDFSKIADGMSTNRTTEQCRQRWTQTVDPSVVKGKWTEEEDKELEDLIAQHGKDFSKIADGMSNNRTSQQCHKRWTESLDPSIVKGRWTEEEDKELEDLIALHGNKGYSKIVAGLSTNRSYGQCRDRVNKLNYYSKIGTGMPTNRTSKQCQERRVEVIAAASQKEKEPVRRKREQTEEEKRLQKKREAKLIAQMIVRSSPNLEGADLDMTIKAIVMNRSLLLRKT